MVKIRYYVDLSYEICNIFGTRGVSSIHVIVIKPKVVFMCNKKVLCIVCVTKRCVRTSTGDHCVGNGNF